MSKQKKDIDNDESENSEFSSDSLDGDGSGQDGGGNDGDGSAQARESHDSTDESLSIEDMCRVASGADIAEKESLDWSTETLMNHPEGIDAAIAKNNEIMLQKTKDVIENGSLEEIAAALEENTRQLQMLHDRMQNLFKIMS